MNQFCGPTRLKAIKKTSSGSFNIKKNRNPIESSFFIKLSFLLFFAFLSHLETSHFSNRGSVKYKPLLQSKEAK